MNYYPNYYYNHTVERIVPGSSYYLPPKEGEKWIDKNVDIQMNDGKCYANVLFRSVNPTAVDPQSGAPTEFIWVFDDYSSPGAPLRRTISHRDVSQINYAGSLCKPFTQQPTGTMPGGAMGPGTGMPGGMGPGTGMPGGMGPGTGMPGGMGPGTGMPGGMGPGTGMPGGMGPGTGMPGGAMGPGSGMPGGGMGCKWIPGINGWIWVCI